MTPPPRSAASLPIQKALTPELPAVAALSSRKELLIVGSLLCLFIFLQVLYPGMPGRQFEGLFKDQFRAVEILASITEGKFLKFLLAGGLPSHDMFYHGTLAAYLFVPFLWLFGPNWWIAKFWPVLFAVPTLIFTYLFARRFFGKTVGLFAIGLTVIHPSYEMGMRIGGDTESYIQFFSTGALYFLSRWWIDKSRWSLCIGMFLIALGMSTMAWFLWFPASLVFCAVLFQRDIRAWLAARPDHSALKWLSFAAGGLLAGSFLLVYRELFFPLGAASTLAELAFSSENPYRLARYLPNLWGALLTLTEYLSGTYFFDLIFAFDHASARLPAVRIYPVLFWSAIVFLFCGPARAIYGHRGLFVSALLLGMLAITPIGRPPYVHLFFLYPLPQLVMACALAGTIAILRKNLKLKLALGGLVVLLATMEIRCLAGYFHQLRTSGGARRFSASIYGVADWLKSNYPGGAVIFSLMEPHGPEYEAHMYFLLPGNRFRFIYGSERDVIQAAHIAESGLQAAGHLLWARSYSLYSKATPWRENPVNSALEQELLERGLFLQRAKTFQDPDGVAVLDIFLIHKDKEQHAIDRRRSGRDSGEAR